MYDEEAAILLENKISELKTNPSIISPAYHWIIAVAEHR
jgi:hypothetical protein